MKKKVEIMFDEKTGRFVVHFEGMRRHPQEHAMLKRLVNELQKQGFDVEMSDYSDDPKIPEAENEGEPERERLSG